MQDDALRILLVEPWKTGMSPTFGQLAQAPGKRLYINFATTCKDALRRLGQSDPYDLLLVSIHLPDADGTQAITQLMEAAHPTPVAALLAGEDGALRDTVEGLGAAGVFWQGGIPVDTIVGDFEAILAATRTGTGASSPRLQTETIHETPPLPVEEESPALTDTSTPESLPEDVSADETAVLQEEIPLSDEDASEPDIGDRLDPEEAISLAQGEMEPDAFAETVPEADAVLLEEAAPGEEASEAETILSLRLLLEQETQRRTLAEESIQALETRCQELEAGQTALIEAEHVGLERERAARETAEAERDRLRAEVASLRGGGAMVSETRYAEEVRVRREHATALQELQAEMDAFRKGREQERTGYEERLAAERHATEVLHNQLTEAQVRLSELEDEHMKLRNEHRHARQVEKHVTQLERRCAELEPLAEENKRCEHALQQAQDALQAAEVRIAELEAEESGHLAVRDERDALLQDLDALKKRMEQEKQDHAAARTDWEREFADLQEERNRLEASMQAEMDSAKTAMEAARVELDSLQAKWAAAKAEGEAARAECDAARSECGAREAERREVEKKLSKALKEARSLQGAEKTLKDREWSLKEAEEALRTSEARVEELVEECNTLTARHAELETVRTQCDARGEEIRQLRSSLQEAQVQVMVLNGELTQLRTVANEVAKRDRQIAEAELRLRAETERREALEVSHAELRATLQDKENALSLLQGQLESEETSALPPVGDGMETPSAAASGVSDPATLQARLEEAEVAIQALRLKGEDADRLTQEVQTLQTRLDQTEATLQAERHTRRALESTLAGLRATRGGSPIIPADAEASRPDKETGMTRQDVAAQIGTLAKSLKADAVWQASFATLLDSETLPLWEAAKKVGAYMNTAAVTPEDVDLCKSIIAAVRDYQGEKARTSTATTTVVFGTSGWRGVIGEDFTVLNVHKVARGIVEMMRTARFLETNGYASFDEVQTHGIVVFRDNRFLGDTFMDAAMQELAEAGIRIHAAGECPTGVGSALVTELDAAGSINFTPSHNPMDYAGIKFNPADGGPAGPELTTLIEEAANAYMVEGVDFVPVDTDPASLRTLVDAPALFTEFVLKKSKVFDLAGIRQWILKRKDDLALVVDFMHGSARGYVQAILGAEVVDALRDAGALVLLNEEEDYSFHGVKPEPSAENQAPLLARLQTMNRPLSLAVALDPDADRIRFADAHLDIDMNRFGAIAYANLLQAGCKGGIASTAPSSDFALEIARRENMEVFETEVGFKNFRAPLGSGAAILAFEESDGISCTGHTLEKCALAGFLLALKAMADQGTNLSDQYAALRKTYGYFYPSKAGADVTGVSVEAWQAYKKAVVEALQTKLYKVGDTVEVGGETKHIASINTIDGLKVIFEDKSWILLRPSGTEPKFRYYFELASATPLDNEAALLKAYEEAGGMILQKARDLVDNA